MVKVTAPFLFCSLTKLVFLANAGQPDDRQFGGISAEWRRRQRPPSCGVDLPSITDVEMRAQMPEPLPAPTPVPVVDPPPSDVPPLAPPPDGDPLSDPMPMPMQLAIA